jgi:hypothetical protein
MKVVRHHAARNKALFMEGKVGVHCTQKDNNKKNQFGCERQRLRKSRFVL